MSAAAFALDLANPAAVRALQARVAERMAPPPLLTVSQFADREIVVTSGPVANTRWSTDFAPYERGILDAFHEPGVQTVVVRGASQWGKTSCAVVIAAYHIAHDPCPILVVSPTLDMAKDFAQNRLDPVIAASPALAAVVSKKRAKDQSNTMLAKTFRGGAIAIGGANSAASLAQRSVRLLVLDEMDRYPAQLAGEGNTIAIAMMRTTAYGRRARTMMMGSPTIKDGPIDSWFHRGDERYYQVPCPSCGSMFVYEWKHVRWVNDDPVTARLHCPSCDYGLDDVDRVAALPHGEWVPSRPDRHDPSIVSFHIWNAYSPMSSLRVIVNKFLMARADQKRGDRSTMHTWQNTMLGEPYDSDAGEGVESQSLLFRREAVEDPEVDVPAGACCLTMGVDVQDDRLETLVVGWGPGEESWIVDRRRFDGDTTQIDAGPWRDLDAILAQPFRHASGAQLMIHATCIDSAGHRTTQVYDYVERRTAQRVYAVIGRDGDRAIVSSPSPKRWGRGERHVDLYIIGVDAAKSLLVSRLALVDELGAPVTRGPGVVHLPHHDWCDEEFIAQLTSERLVTKWEKGIPRLVWKKMRARNEALDCFVYATAALRLLNPKLALMAQRLMLVERPPGPAADGAPRPAPPAISPRPAPPQRRVSRSSYLGR